MNIYKKYMSDEELHNIPHLGEISRLSAETILEGAYLLDRWVFCMQRGKCFGRNVEKLYRKPRVKRW